MNDLHLELRQRVKPTCLLVRDIALLLEPLQASVVRVQLKRPVEEVWTQDLERVDHCEQL